MKNAILELKMDKQGRVIIPADWRKNMKTKNFLAIAQKDYIKLIPERKPDLTKYFGMLKVDIKAPLSDWHAVKRELMAKKLERYGLK